MADSPLFRMPAEWEPHRATWLAWPHRRSDWPGKFRIIPHVYAEIIRVLSRHEEVRIIVDSEVERDRARKRGIQHQVLSRGNGTRNGHLIRWPYKARACIDGHRSSDGTGANLRRFHTDKAIQYVCE